MFMRVCLYIRVFFVCLRVYIEICVFVCVFDICMYV